MPVMIPVLAFILIGGRAANGLARQLTMPGLLGELVLGLAIGPVLLGWFPNPSLLTTLGQLGVLLLMLLAGLETDLGALRGVGVAACLSAFLGAMLPFGLATALTAAAGEPIKMALFVGAGLSATSVSITAATLRELGKLQTRAGRTILLAAAVDDVLVLLLVALIGDSSSGSPLLSAGRVLLFLAIAGLAGWLLPGVLKRVAPHVDSLLALVIGIGLLTAWAAERFGDLAPITGAYLAGVLLARAHPLASDWSIARGLETLTTGFFATIFFVSLGLDVQLTAIPFPFFAALFLLAITTKLIGCGLGARVAGLSRDEAVTVGMGMVPRGEVALIIAALGLQRGVLPSGMFSLLVLVVVCTTVLTPIGLRGLDLMQTRFGVVRPAPLAIGSERLE